MTRYVFRLSFNKHELGELRLIGDSGGLVFREEFYENDAVSLIQQTNRPARKMSDKQKRNITLTVCFFTTTLAWIFLWSFMYFPEVIVFF